MSVCPLRANALKESLSLVVIAHGHSLANSLRKMIFTTWISLIVITTRKLRLLLGDGVEKYADRNLIRLLFSVKNLSMDLEWLKAHLLVASHDEVIDYIQEY